ncbi:hypothetical protein [uncultured Zhongshania sp.]|uniref:hypothetical protein n=1 Tax=uncultured Zhongshania sp. TaxID=1642288 RepID=UPI0030DC5683
MASFNATIAKRDLRMLSRLGNELVWTKTDTSTVDGNGIIDLEAEIYGDNDAVPYIGKVVTVARSFVGVYAMGETITDILTGKAYKLQRVVKDDGHVRTIEITT